MTIGEIAHEIVDGIGVLVIENPPVNAISDNMYHELVAKCETFEADEQVKVCVLIGAGDRAFCAGADLKDLGQLDLSERSQHQSLLINAFLSLSSLSLPLIGAINGPAIGAGFALASLCDYRIMSDSAHVALPEIKYGSVTGGGVYLRQIGVREGALREILFSGRRVEAAECETLGLVDRLVPAGTVRSAAMALAHVWAGYDRIALRSTKRAMAQASRSVGWESGLSSTREYARELWR